MEKVSELIYKLPQKDKALLDSFIVAKALKRGELLFDHFATDSSIYYVAKGLLRKYIIKDGNEKTLDFYFTDELYFPHILHPIQTTNCFLQALENSTVFQLDNFKFDKIKIDSFPLVALENRILETALAQTAERLQNFQTMSATDRYTNLLDRNPKIVQKIPLIYVASYLGINNASLSKIRATLK